MIIDFTQFYLQQSEPNRSCLMAMRELLLRFDSTLSETRKYGMPCFLKNKKAFCYLWIDKKSTFPYFLIVNSDKIDHPLLERGNRKRMKTLPIDPNLDMPIETIETILSLAMAQHPK